MFVHIVKEIVEVSVLSCFAWWTGFVLLICVLVGIWLWFSLVLFFSRFVFSIDHFLILIFGRVGSGCRRLWRQWL